MRLLEISFLDNEVFKSKKIKFTRVYSQSSENYTTVIIGPNGTGKSILLREIVRMFKDLRGRNGGNYQKRTLEYNYLIRFYADNVLNEVIEKKGIRTYLVQGKSAHLYDWHFPNRIVAVSTILSDKFVFSNGDGFYKYAGIRSSNNNAGTKSVIKQIVESMSECKYTKLISITEVLNTLGFEKVFVISYEFRYHRDIQNFNTIEDIDNFFINWAVRSKRKTTPFSFSNYKSLNGVDKNDILNFIIDKISSETFKYDVFDHDDFKNFINDYRYIQLLAKLDLVTSPTIYFKKKEYIDETSISSGEYNIIFQFLRIVLNVEDDCLLLIDEPETSLHPNWQINYLNILSNCLSAYSGIHTIIATHSNLMLSNLKIENTSVLSVTKNSDFDLIDFSVSGWSPENILYQVFNITSFRNYYFEMDIRKLVKFIESKNWNNEEIIQIINRLDKYKLKNNDPLTKIIEEAKKNIDL